MTIAALSTGERATLDNILSRGLASLTKRQRDDSTVELVRKLQTVLRETANLDNYRARVLMLLMFAPRGLDLLGVNPTVLEGMQRDGAVEKIDLTGRSRWAITRQGWMRMWDSGRAQAVLADRYALPELAAEVAA